MDWTAIQHRLLKLGFNPGPIDGVRGRMTINALRRFQEANGLTPDGIVGPKTRTALMGEEAPGRTPELDRMPWFEEARRLIGVTETKGAASTSTIIDWARGQGIDYNSDDIPWCGLFVAHCIGSALPAEALPGNPLRARAWASFGMRVRPQLGAVMVFWRKPKASGNGHVGFYHGEDHDAYLILGGNQSDKVNVTRVGRDRFLDARWPLTALDPTGEVVEVAATGELSLNEA